MTVTTLDEKIIQDIGHAFSCYDHGEEHGLIDAFPVCEAVVAFIGGYVRMTRKAGCCIPWGNGEGYIAYRLSGQKVGLKAVLPLAKAFLGAMGLKALIRFARIMSKGGSGLDKQFDREKKPPISMWDWSACGSLIRGRGICGRLWTRRFPRATGLESR